MLGYQHSLATAGSNIHLLSPLATVTHSLSFSSSRSPGDTDDSSMTTDHNHHPTIMTASHQFADPDNDDRHRATELTTDDANDLQVAAAHNSPREHDLNCSYIDEEDDDVTDVKQRRDVIDERDAVTATSLSPATRSRLLAMLPTLMSAASYKRLVDEGHVTFPDRDRDDQVDVVSLSPSTSGVRHAEEPDDVKITLTMPPEKTSSGAHDDHGLGRRSMDRRLDESESSTDLERKGHAVYACHICDFLCQSKTLFDEHMNSRHYVHQCTMCRYSAKTAGRLQRHVADFHSGTRRPSTSTSSSVGGATNLSTAARRRFKCRRCDYVTDNQAAYWCHGRQHINPKDLFECLACPFATRFKHHMMYHVLSHLDINPFSCAECGYPCKNKSMLKSHMKTHTNVYQYQCAFSGCTFVTKYCHAMNQHLSKYTNHKPAEMLNADGSLPTLRHLILPDEDRDRATGVEISSSASAFGLPDIAKRRKRRCHFSSTHRNISGSARRCADDVTIGSVTSSPPIEINMPASLARCAMERDTHLVDPHPANASREPYGTTAAWPRLWTTAAATGQHPRHHHHPQAAAASTAAITGTGNLFPMLYQPWLNLPPPVLSLGPWASPFLWPKDRCVWTPTAKCGTVSTADHSGIMDVRQRLGHPITSLAVSSPGYEKHKLRDYDIDMTSSHYGLEQTPPAVENTKLKRVSSFHEQSESRLSSIAGNGSRQGEPSSETSMTDHAKYRVDGSFQSALTSEPSSFTKDDVKNYEASESPIDLTKASQITSDYDRQQSTSRCSSADNEERSTPTLQPSTKLRHVAVVDVGVIAEELRWLRKTVGTEPFASDKDSREKMVTEKVVPLSGSTEQEQQQQYNTSNWFGGGASESSERRRGGTGTGSAVDKPEPQTRPALRTPPTSGNLSLTIQPVARRIDTGFDGDEGISHLRDNQDDANVERSVHSTDGSTRPSFNYQQTSPSNESRTSTDRLTSSWDFPATSVPADIGRILSQVGTHFRSYFFEKQRSLESEQSNIKINGSGGGGKMVTSRVSSRNARSSTPTKTKYECPCGIFYAHRDTYDMHMAFHYSDSEPFRCRLCDRRYTGAIDFYCHVIRYPHDMTSQHMR